MAGNAVDNRRVSIDHYENFPVASWMCPPRLRPPIMAIYRFARCADDIADEGAATSAQRLDTLSDYARSLDAAIRGVPAQRWSTVFAPLGQAIADFDLPTRLLWDLLDAFTQDCSNPYYDDRQQLLDYCRRSANPVGRLLLHLDGVRDAVALEQSDAICSALQLINFWQDPSVDLPRGRSYFPLRDLQRHGLHHDDMKAGLDTPVTEAVIAELCAWAGDLMLEGSPLVSRLSGRMGWELRFVVQGGLRVLEKIAVLRYRTLGRRPTLGVVDAPFITWRAAWMTATMGGPREVGT